MGGLTCGCLSLCLRCHHSSPALPWSALCSRPPSRLPWGFLRRASVPASLRRRRRRRSCARDSTRCTYRQVRRVVGANAAFESAVQRPRGSDVVFALVGFLPPGPPPPITPPVSVPPPHTPPMSIPNRKLGPLRPPSRSQGRGGLAAGLQWAQGRGRGPVQLHVSVWLCPLAALTGVNGDTTKDLPIGNPIPTVVSGARGSAESGDSAKMFGSAVPPAAPPSLPAPPVTQPVSLLGKWTCCHALLFLCPR